jgi:hypothetical protein
MPRMGLRVPLMNMTSWWPFVKRVVSPLKKETASVLAIAASNTAPVFAKRVGKI